jgi:light-regulated signal transduction histidine kinase (bacteriophytochrome)
LETQRLSRELSENLKELEDYAQIVSHDLKSPLRSIHSLLSWIKRRIVTRHLTNFKVFFYD